MTGLEAKLLTPTELRNSKLSDFLLHSIWTEFDSPGGKHYLAIHVRKHPNGPYVLLSSPDRDESDFTETEGKVVAVVDGRPEKKVTNRGSDICDVIKLLKNPSQVEIANIVEAYAAVFSNVIITVAHYDDVPPDDDGVYEGLQREKLTFT